MGSFIVNNDTLRINKTQGFPAELDIKKHLKKPYLIKCVEGKVFEFQAKEGIRVYQAPPIRNFLVEDVDGKWLYWGLCHIIEITHDYVNRTTAGKFKIIKINSPEEMKKAFELIDRVEKNNYF